MAMRAVSHAFWLSKPFPKGNSRRLSSSPDFEVTVSEGENRHASPMDRKGRKRMMLRRLKLAFASVLAAGFITGPAFAGGAINETFFGTALKGYDAVAYHTLGKPIEGNRQFTYKWSGATWHFISSKHRDLFAVDPVRYAPAYGGYCAYAMAQGAMVDIDPNAWRIINGTLYLNVNKDVQRTWAQNIFGYIRRADGHWQKFMG
jgi:YHS domain-containing protein